MIYKVIADREEFDETFDNYLYAYDWLTLVRGVFGCNAGIVTLGAELA